MRQENRAMVAFVRCTAMRADDVGKVAGGQNTLTKGIDLERTAAVRLKAIKNLHHRIRT